MNAEDYLSKIEKVEDPEWENSEKIELRAVLTSPLVLRAMKRVSEPYHQYKDSLLNVSPWTPDGQRQIAETQARVKSFFALVDSLLALATPSEGEKPNA